MLTKTGGSIARWGDEKTSGSLYAGGDGGTLFFGKRSG